MEARTLAARGINADCIPAQLSLPRNVRSEEITMEVIEHAKRQFRGVLADYLSKPITQEDLQRGSSPFSRYTVSVIDDTGRYFFQLNLKQSVRRYGASLLGLTEAEQGDWTLNTLEISNIKSRPKNSLFLSLFLEVAEEVFPGQRLYLEVVRDEAILSYLAMEDWQFIDDAPDSGKVHGWKSIHRPSIGKELEDRLKDWNPDAD